MHPSTRDAAARVRAASALEPQLRALADRFRGEPCVIVTCGPSLATISPVALRHALGGVLTIVVKQAIDVVGEQADFQCWNSFNVRRFTVPSPDTLRCFVAEPTGRIIQHNPADLCFPLQPAEGDLTRSLAASGDFDTYRLDARTTRPFGPGIMYELCFYLAVHLGVAEILTIGWDIANSDGKNTHFYDRANDQRFFESERADPAEAATRSMRPKMPETVRRPARWVRTYRSHRRDEVYNRTRVLAGETDLVAASTGPLAAWLSEYGIGLTIATDSSHFDPRIRRVPIDGVVDHIAAWPT